MPDKKKIVVIGGSAAGPKAATKARRLDENAEIVIIQKAPDLSMASCGYPYYVGGFFDDRNMLLCTPTGVVRNPKFYLNAKGIVARNVITDNAIAEFLGEKGKLTGVKLQNGTELPCEPAVVAIGVSPNVKLAKEAGLEIGAIGGIVVNEHMQTSDPDIYAAGDCVESTNLITGKKVHAPYGDLANLQGRVAGDNAAAGNNVTFPSTIQTGICKVFDFAAGSTGISEKAARASGFTDIETVINASPDKPGFMEGLLLITKLVVERKSGKILGAQCVGHGDVSKPCGHRDHRGDRRSHGRNKAVGRKDHRRHRPARKASEERRRLGGRIDHELCNVVVCARHPGTLRLLDESSVIVALDAGKSHSGAGSSGDIITLAALDDGARCSAMQLRYALRDEFMVRGSRGVSNAIEGGSFPVSVSPGTVLVLQLKGDHRTA